MTRKSRVHFTRTSLVAWLLLPVIGGVLLIAIQRYSNSSLPTSYPIQVTSVSSAVDIPNLVITATPMTAGNIAPPVTLTGLNGKVYRLQDLHGKDVILNFWATWCPPCKQEMPLLETTNNQMKDRGIVVIGINDKEPIEEITPFIQNMGITFPIWLDPTERSFQDYQIVGLPTTYFIDRQGRLVDENIGPLNPAKMTDYLNKLKAADR